MKIADEYVWLAIEAGRAACRRKVLPVTEAELFAFTKGALEQHVGAVCDALAGVDTVQDTFLPAFPEACPACAAQLRSDHKNGERCPGCGQPVILV